MNFIQENTTDMKRRTKQETIEFMGELSRLNISHAIFSNWNKGLTKIPTVYLEHEREFLKKYLSEPTKQKYNLL